MQKHNRPVVILPISGIPDVSYSGVKVRFKDTGRDVWLPRQLIDFLPGRVIIPVWLFKKFFLKRNKSGTVSS